MLYFTSEKSNGRKGAKVIVRDRIFKGRNDDSSEKNNIVFAKRNCRICVTRSPQLIVQYGKVLNVRQSRDASGNLRLLELCQLVLIPADLKTHCFDWSVTADAEH